jgi:hypothetical protein
MKDHRIAEMQGVVARYLDGVESFDIAARQLAVVIRGRPPASPTSSDRPVLSLKPFSLRSTPDIRIAELDLAPGRGEADRAKAHALFSEAMRLAPTIEGEAV